MDNTQTTSHSPGADYFSMGMTFCFILLKIVDTYSKSDLTFWLTILVGGSTLLYNAIRIYKEIKK